MRDQGGVDCTSGSRDNTERPSTRLRPARQPQQYTTDRQRERVRTTSRRKYPRGAARRMVKVGLVVELPVWHSRPARPRVPQPERPPAAVLAAVAAP